MSDYAAELLDVRCKPLFAFCCFPVLYHDPLRDDCLSLWHHQKVIFEPWSVNTPLPESFQRLILLSVRLLSDSVVLVSERRIEVHNEFPIGFTTRSRICHAVPAPPDLLCYRLYLLRSLQ